MQKFIRYCLGILIIVLFLIIAGLAAALIFVITTKDAEVNQLKQQLSSSSSSVSSSSRSSSSRSSSRSSTNSSLTQTYLDSQYDFSMKYDPDYRVDSIPAAEKVTNYGKKFTNTVDSKQSFLLMVDEEYANYELSDALTTFIQEKYSGADIDSVNSGEKYTRAEFDQIISGKNSKTILIGLDLGGSIVLFSYTYEPQNGVTTDPEGLQKMLSMVETLARG